MSLSVITPHYNDFDGLKRILTCLQEQTYKDWEWVIVDDCSDKSVLINIEEWKSNINDNRIRFIKNTSKSNASVCRNKGIELAKFENLVFLDSDDYIAEDFVSNRQIAFNEFAIFPNFHVVDNTSHFIKKELKNKEDLLNKFLAAQFLWQTSCILWKKNYLTQIGEFDPNLERLQDVELCLRALFDSENYKIIDNKVDFFYYAKPISLKPEIVRKSCESVNYLISKLNTNYSLDSYRKSLIKRYYFACVKGLHRCKNRTNTIYVKESLKLFSKLKYINLFEYIVGYILLKLYQYHLISDSLFIRINRYIFKY